MSNTLESTVGGAGPSPYFKNREIHVIQESPELEEDKNESGRRRGVFIPNMGIQVETLYSQRHAQSRPEPSDSQKNEGTEVLLMPSFKPHQAPQQPSLLTPTHQLIPRIPPKMPGRRQSVCSSSIKRPAEIIQIIEPQGSARGRRASIANLQGNTSTFLRSPSKNRISGPGSVVNSQKGTLSPAMRPVTSGFMKFNFESQFQYYKKQVEEDMDKPMLTGRRQESKDMAEGMKTLNVENVNRNKRFFKSYLKDQQLNTFKSQKELLSANKKESIQKDNLFNDMSFLGHSVLKRKKSTLDMNGIFKQKHLEKTLKKLGNNKDSKKMGQIRRKSDIDISKTHLDSKVITAAEEEQHQVNSDDSFEEEKQIRFINANQYKNAFLIRPDVPAKAASDFISFALIFLLSFYVPFKFAFEVPSTKPIYIFEVVLDCWFIQEIIVNFFTGYYAKGVLVMDRKEIAINYIKGWFLVDVISSVPYSFFKFGSMDSYAAGGGVSQSRNLLRLLKLLKYVRLLRMLRFLKVNKLLQGLEDVIVSESMSLFLKMVKLIVMALLFTHWLACVQNITAQHQYQSEGQSWLTQQRIVDADLSELYIDSLYWAMTTMTTVGYGDFSPYSTLERLTVMAGMLLSSGIYGYIIQDVSRSVSSFNYLAEQYREHMAYVDRFLTEKQIPKDLRQAIRRYLEYNLELKKVYKIEESDVLSLLNEGLRNKIQMYLHGRLISSVDVFSQFPIEIVCQLTFILHKQTYILNQDLVIENDWGQELFFICNGRVCLLHKKSRTYIKELGTDATFGEIGFFSDTARSVTVKARDFTDILLIKRDDFLTLAEQVSQDSLIKFQFFFDFLEQNPGDVSILDLKCYLCEVGGHIATNCKLFKRKMKGNLKKYYKNLYQEVSEESHEVDSKPKMASVNDSYNLPMADTQRSRQKRSKRRRKRKIRDTEFTKRTPKNSTVTLKASTSNELKPPPNKNVSQFKRIHDENLETFSKGGKESNYELSSSSSSSSSPSISPSKPKRFKQQRRKSVEKAPKKLNDISLAVAALKRFDSKVKRRWKKEEDWEVKLKPPRRRIKVTDLWRKNTPPVIDQFRDIKQSQRSRGRRGGINLDLALKMVQEQGENQMEFDKVQLPSWVQTNSQKDLYKELFKS